ncbi:conserved hypothetical protein [Trichinella spiralis]|uniref:hypothetical protein n=1 Tax=Trichinella spiralis TaxID=6334 RepID=UPI0001EFDFDB|nr:conserved hypothetical protein [Trichinella spiralis]
MTSFYVGFTVSRAHYLDEESGAAIIMSKAKIYYTGFSEISLDQWFSKSSHSDSGNEVVLLQATSAQRRCADLPSTVSHNICLRIEHANNVRTIICTKADRELTDLSEDSSFKVSFDRKTLTQFVYQSMIHKQTSNPFHHSIKSVAFYYYFLLV